MPITILIVDDHPVVRAGLRAVIETHAAISVVGEAATGEAALELVRKLRPDVVLCDLRLGDGMDGIATTAALRALPSAPAVLIVSTFDRDADVVGAIEAGACGYLIKDVPPAQIIDAIEVAARGGSYLPAQLASQVVRSIRSPRPKLTAREVEVLALLATGRSNREISKTLFVSEATVKSHLVHIFTKLDVDSRTRAIHVATERGII